MPFQRQTRQRRVIMEELTRLSAHPTAADLCEAVRRRLPNVSLATVYRNLERLAEVGQIRKLEMGANQARYDAVPDGHHHVRCRRCGSFADAAEAPRRLGIEQIDELSGYKVEEYRLEFIGLCPACREDQATD